MLESFGRGAVAQLGERRVRNAKVGSSILLRSTIQIKGLAAMLGPFYICPMLRVGTM
ncbi:hypothetical protein BCAR13_890037 [Paraburkholderia caribensis]|nr:hypothetical protein BCAR13_890037 [Paraburkholderia caribensis]